MRLPRYARFYCFVMYSHVCMGRGGGGGGGGTYRLPVNLTRPFLFLSQLNECTVRHNEQRAAYGKCFVVVVACVVGLRGRRGSRT